MTTLWFHPTAGNDTTNDGSAGSPYKTPKGAIDWLKANGLSGTVQIKAQAPGKIRCDIVLDGLLPGQRGAAQLQIIGAPDFASVKSYPWSPLPGQTALTVSGGGAVTVQGFYVDYLDAYNEAGYGSARIAINSGTRSTVYSRDMGFGYTANNAAFVNVQDMGTHQHFGDLLIEALNASATGTLSTASPVIQITGLTGALPLTPGVGVFGNGIPPCTFIGSVNGNSITLASDFETLVGPTFPTLDGPSALTFHGGVSAPFGIGQMSILLNGNWNAPGGGVTWIRGRPHFVCGLLYADEMAAINWGSLCINPDTKAVKTVTGAAGSPVLTISDPSALAVNFYAHAPQIPFGAKVVSIDGTTVTLDKAATATPSSVMFGSLPKIIGPQCTVHGNSYIRPPGFESRHLPGVPWKLAHGRGRGRVGEGSHVCGPALTGAIHEEREII